LDANEDLPYICILCQAKSIASSEIIKTLAKSLNTSTRGLPSTPVLSAAALTVLAAEEDTDLDYLTAQSECSDTEQSGRGKSASSEPAAKKTLKHTSSLPPKKIVPDSPPPPSHQDSPLHNPNHIVILDGLKSPNKYRDSRAILEELRSVKPDLHISSAYLLPAGGIALHCNSLADTEIALADWPTTAFEGSKLHPHPPSSAGKRTSVIARNIPRNISDSDIATAVTDQIKKTVTVRRFYNRRTNQPMPIVEINYNHSGIDTASSILISEGLKVGAKVLPCEEKRITRVIRCYRCQHFGHTAATCENNDKICVDCSLPLTDKHQCTSRLCVNCKGHHSSDSKHCPAYKLTYNTITARSLKNRRHSFIRNEVHTVEL